jgi:hypothetical protein
MSDTDTITLQDLSLGDLVDFEVVVATALAEGVAATVHDDKDFIVEAKARNV